MEAYEAYRCAKCKAVYHTIKDGFIKAINCHGGCELIWVCNRCGHIHPNQYVADRCCKEPNAESVNLKLGPGELIE